jgi:protein-tyrosine phosphatase
MAEFRFAAASPDEAFVFGAQRPGYRSPVPIPPCEVITWMDFIDHHSIRRVCCLLEDQLSYYEGDLLETYRKRFGKDNVRWAPIADFTFASENLLTETVLPFLASSVRRRERVVVHCSGGNGRTGHVLAAWLVYGHNLTNEEAVKAVITSGRDPYEAEGQGSAGRAKLKDLLDACRRVGRGVDLALNHRTETE